jgi:hypothetical protein
MANALMHRLIMVASGIRVINVLLVTFVDEDCSITAPTARCSE